MIDKVAASLGAAVASGIASEIELTELLATGLERFADLLDSLTKLLEAYASKKGSKQ